LADEILESNLKGINGMVEQFSIVGKRLPRPDAVPKATGAAQYAVDIKVPGMLIGKVLRSPYPHAKILKVDKSKAEELPGVEAVITIEDVPKKLYNGGFFDLKMPPERASRVVRDQYVLADKARYVGDGIAAVAAINETIAEKALELIYVEYEKLQAVFDPVEAMKPGAPRIHEFAERNIAQHMSYAFAIGDVERGFQEADYIVEETFRTSKQKHCQLELDASIATFDATGRLTVWSQCAAPHLAKRSIAEIFNMPEGMVKLITPCIGGAFGGRSNLNNELICVALARKSGKPVKIEYTREEDFIVHHSREAFIQTGKIGVKKDGTITALQTKVINNGGAYFEASGATTGFNLGTFMAVYRCSNMAGEGDIVYTNIPISGGMRGFGNPAGMFVLEQLVDMVCEKIEMDPVEFRLKNHKRTGDPSWYPPCPITSCALDECIKVGAERIGWKAKKEREKDGLRRRGVGMAIMSHPTDAYHLLTHSSAWVKINEDGSVNIVVSPAEIGQGVWGVLAQIGAEELGVQVEDIHLVTGDTDITTFDTGTYCSRSTYSTGNAVLGAAREAKNQLLQRAAKMLDVSANELETKNKRVYVKSAPEKTVSIAEVAKDAIYNFRGECLHISGRCSYQNNAVSPSFQAGFAEVEVDTETGEIKVLKIVVAHDIGRAINPRGAEGQLEGGVVQGVGYSLIEDFVIHGETGVVISDNFTTYKIPSTLDLPEIEVILIEGVDPAGPFGAKSCGEAGLVTIAPAIANAIYNAIGIRVTELPMTPEKIIQALRTELR
jgi:xanthine dehydrogenase molybdenum-binding subunit